MAETMGYIVICVILQLLPRTLTNVFCSSERLKREQRGVVKLVMEEQECW